VKYKITILVFFLLTSCESNQIEMEKIIFLHHSTGYRIWIGKTNRYIYKFTKKNDVQKYLKKFNKRNKTNFSITEQVFPKESPYGWKNNPFDYYNIWVKNAGDRPYLNEPTLEILTKEYKVIVFKHCFPISNISEDTGNANIDSEEQTLENYKLQYHALKKKIYEFPKTKFILWTPAVHVKNNLTPEEAQRTNDFRDWIIDEWDKKGDNIFVWDFYNYETEGGLYLLDKYATGSNDSHPNKLLSGRLAPLFAQFVIDVANGNID
jgi:hypothetical protein